MRPWHWLNALPQLLGHHVRPFLSRTLVDDLGALRQPDRRLGTLYYAFSLYVAPMQADLGWSATELNGALSLGLLTWGLAAFSVGAWIDKHGGRALMTCGSLIGALALALWSQVDSLIAFYAIYALMGVAMAMLLYDPAFAVVTAAFKADARKAITAITLAGGFASTIFMPLAHLLIELFGWRDSLLMLAGVNLALGAAIGCTPKAE